MQNVKTKPLVRYPGSKSRKTKKLTSMFPTFTGTYYEPFIGSGVISIYQQETNPNRKIVINDIYWDLYNLWVNVQQNGKQLVDRCITIRDKYDPNQPLGKELFNEMTELYNNGDNLDKAISFFVRNKIGFSGVGGVSKSAYQKTFNNGNTLKLLEISNIIKDFEIYNLDYEIVLKDINVNDFVFLDPPYDIKDMLYGKNGEIHKGFDHKRFCDVVKRLPCQWMITYNDNETLREWFKNYTIIEEEYDYCMSFETTDEGKKQRKKTELIITNY